MADFPPVGLLTWFGTLLCHDADTDRIVHARPEDITGPLSPLRVEQRGDGYGVAVPRPSSFVARLVLKETSRQPLLTLWRQEWFLNPRAEGATYLDHTGSPGDHALLLPLLARDASLLFGALPHAWTIGQQARVPAGLARFNMSFGKVRVDLRKMLPLDPASTPERLVFTGGTVVERAPRKPPAQPVVWLNPVGNIGNRGLQYLAAQGIARRVPGAVVRNIALDMWGMEAPAPRPPAWESAATGWRYRFDTEGLADCLRRGEVRAVIVEAYPYHLDHYPPRRECRALLPPLDVETTAFGDNELVCSIRGNEILRGEHKDYFPLPPAYYRMLQEESGLGLVFFGQLGDDAYTNGLRAAFPQARFIRGRDQAHDFESLRRARNIALSISTFAWLAAWLGEPERVYLPVGGMFNPVQHPDQLFIAPHEPGFRYVLLPPADAEDMFKSPARFWLMQDYLARNARFAGADEIAALCARADKLGHGPVRVKSFESGAYIRKYGDAIIEVRGLDGTALGHLLAIGPGTTRQHRPFDALFYGDMYPDAAADVAAGHYPTLFAHFTGKGEALGYRPIP